MEISFMMLRSCPMQGSYQTVPGICLITPVFHLLYFLKVTLNNTVFWLAEDFTINTFKSSDWLGPILFLSVTLDQMVLWNMVTLLWFVSLFRGYDGFLWNKDLPDCHRKYMEDPVYDIMQRCKGWKVRPSKHLTLLRNFGRCF